MASAAFALETRPPPDARLHDPACRRRQAKQATADRVDDRCLQHVADAVWCGALRRMRHEVGQRLGRLPD
jgi:hypothetical protein